MLEAALKFEPDNPLELELTVDEFVGAGIVDGCEEEEKLFEGTVVVVLSRVPLLEMLNVLRQILMKINSSLVQLSTSYC